MINTILTSIFSYNLKDWLFLLFLLILAAITVHTISWCGSVLHSVTNSGRPYAVFTFRADQNKGMSTNILMNILIPNVVLIFLSMFCYNMKELALCTIYHLYLPEAMRLSEEYTEILYCLSSGGSSGGRVPG